MTVDDETWRQFADAYRADARADFMRGVAHVRAQLAAGVARRPRPPAIADTPSARVAALLSPEARQALTTDEQEPR